MILLYLGRDVDEEELARLMRSRTFGTPASNIRFLSSLGFDIVFELGTESDLHSHLSQQLPCIIFLKTNALPHWHVENTHAVVLVGLTDEAAYIHDPAFDDAPLSVPLPDFLLAWSEFDYEYAVIKRA